jgi:cytochrome c-type biogenesis protein
MSAVGVVAAGPLLLAIPVAAAAGAVTFLSPCVLPLVPGYLSYVTGMSGAGTGARRRAKADTASPADAADTADAADAADAADTVSAGRKAADPAIRPASGGTAVSVATAPAQRLTLVRPDRSRALAGAALFVLGFSVLFAIEGVAVGSVGTYFEAHKAGMSQLLGILLIVLGLLFAGAFERFSFTGRIVKPSFRPRAGLATAPLVGVLFGLGWTPCSGPTLSAVLALGLSTGTALRGGLLAFVYALGIGIPFLIVAFAVDRGITLVSFARRHGRLITQIGGLLLIAVGLLEVTGAWNDVMIWLQAHWLAGYNAPF